MSEPMKRYELCHYRGWEGESEMEESPDGDWVRWKDVAGMRFELDRLRAFRDAFRSGLGPQILCDISRDGP